MALPELSVDQPPRRHRAVPDGRRVLDLRVHAAHPRCDDRHGARGVRRDRTDDLVRPGATRRLPSIVSGAGCRRCGCAATSATSRADGRPTSGAATTLRSRCQLFDRTLRQCSSSTSPSIRRWPTEQPHAPVRPAAGRARPTSRTEASTPSSATTSSSTSTTLTARRRSCTACLPAVVCAWSTCRHGAASASSSSPPSASVSPRRRRWTTTRRTTTLATCGRCSSGPAFGRATSRSRGTRAG